VTASTTEPAPPAPAAAPARPGPTGIVEATAIIAAIGVVVALIGLGILLLPVTTPTQDCGTSAGFLLGGRVDQMVSETDPPAGVTAAEAKANNASPCRERVADRAKPAALLLGTGLIAALGAALAEMAIRLVRRSKRRRAGAAPQPRAADDRSAPAAS